MFDENKTIFRFVSLDFVIFCGEKKENQINEVPTQKLN